MKRRTDCSIRSLRCARPLRCVRPARCPAPDPRRPDAHRRRTPARFTLPLVFLLLSGCTGPQSALDPAGVGAEMVVELFWWMVGGAALIWAVVIGLALYALRARPEAHSRGKAAFLIIGGGAVVPTLVLAGYLTYGLSIMPRLLAPAPDGSTQIRVSGERWWWRVEYETPSGASVELANEIRLPVGEPTEIVLETPDVIHSFWIPSIGGKMDMIPGRVNRLTLEPTRTGVFRGTCAEYCGDSHAWMSFHAVVMERDAFDEWLAHQAQPAPRPEGPLAARGEQAFLANGCGSCHAVRGTEADGVVGPDLTHVGGRMSLGAGMLPNDRDGFFRWISHTEEIKPAVLMPSFGMLPESDLRALSAYLEGLQ